MMYATATDCSRLPGRPRDSNALSRAQLVTRHMVAENVQHRRILIVEDNIVNQKLAVRMMEKLGYQPDVVGNGQEALTALAKGDYAAILMDCQMPIMDGFETTRNIRQSEAAMASHDSPDGSPNRSDTSPQSTPHIPIIAVTANAMQGDRERCLAIGMDDYLAKPIKLDELRAPGSLGIRATGCGDYRQAKPIPTVADSKVFDPAKCIRTSVATVSCSLNSSAYFSIVTTPCSLTFEQPWPMQTRSPLNDWRAPSKAPLEIFAPQRLHLLPVVSKQWAASRSDAPSVYAQLELEVARLCVSLNPPAGLSADHPGSGLIEAAA